MWNRALGSRSRSSNMMLKLSQYANTVAANHRRCAWPPDFSFFATSRRLTPREPERSARTSWASLDAGGSCGAPNGTHRSGIRCRRMYGCWSFRKVIQRSLLTDLCLNSKKITPMDKSSVKPLTLGTGALESRAMRLWRTATRAGPERDSIFRTAFFADALCARLRPTRPLGQAAPLPFLVIASRCLRTAIWTCRRPFGKASDHVRNGDVHETRNALACS